MEMKIVILPGLDGTGVLSCKIRESLSTNYKVETISYPPNLSHYNELLDWLYALLPSEDFIIVAESFSGPLAAMIAAKHPKFLKGVVFVATFAQRPRNLPASFAYIFQVVPIKSSYLAQMVQPILMGKWSNRDFTSTFKQALNKVPASTLSKRLAEVLKVDVISQLTEISVPILYLQAKNDRLVPQRMSAPFNRASATFCAIEGPHFLLQANAGEAATKISEFIGSLD
ncbi:alpha/beta fold hydrolase [Pseudovibrio brasiliensis]|uniref:Alpha/beta hydrolase n=1 Tax=Pseudovibrio brasiliensis TaxID=1898042 RepID=A0ABX8AKM7_9HYPH|nr:alpha/beta fold hydrolase [Pseudovibrio brasiliensis]QUS55523.1 alpha/beta hydrolase [Pseudovibrio brasiliensis]